MKLIMLQPWSLLRPNRFSEVAEEVGKLGFDPTTQLFVLALCSKGVMRKSFWERKSGVYRRFGLSENEPISAFGDQPMFRKRMA